MNTHTIKRLRDVNPVATEPVHDDALLAAILGTRGDSRLRSSRARQNWHRRPLVAAVAAGALLLVTVGAGIAASRLFKSPAQEEQGLPAGSAIFIGTHPTCAAAGDQQFHCVLTSAPTVESAAGSYLGAKMLSVDATKHIDGGCIATSDNGLEWDCYLGQPAVTHDIVDQSLLGQYLPQPSHG